MRNQFIYPDRIIHFREYYRFLISQRSVCPCSSLKDSPKMEVNQTEAITYEWYLCSRWTEHHTCRGRKASKEINCGSDCSTVDDSFLYQMDLRVKKGSHVFFISERFEWSTKLISLNLFCQGPKTQKFNVQIAELRYINVVCTWNQSFLSVFK